MVAGSEHDVLGSETKDSTLCTATVVSVYDHFLWWLPEPELPQDDATRQSDACIT